MNLLKLTRTKCIDPSFIKTRFIMTDEGSVLVKISSDLAGYHHYLCVFQINQLTVKVSNIIYHFIIIYNGLTKYI